VVRTLVPSRWLTFPNYTHSEPRFRALLTDVVDAQLTLV
jgi:hypothetical protein